MIYQNKLLFDGNGHGKLLFTLPKINENLECKSSISL